MSGRTIIYTDLDPYHLAWAADKLREYAQALRYTAKMLPDDLSEVAAEEAREHYTPDIVVTTGEGAVSASGENVVFEEFGAGARISDPFPGGTDADMEIRRGAYSDLVGGPYAENDYEYWMHDGERYEYVTPTNALFYGMEAARGQAAEKASKILNPTGIWRMQA